jgi:hypothetical protein
MIVCAWDLYVLVEPMNITRHTQVVRLYVMPLSTSFQPYRGHGGTPHTHYKPRKCGKLLMHAVVSFIIHYYTLQNLNGFRLYELS